MFRYCLFLVVFNVVGTFHDWIYTAVKGHKVCPPVTITNGLINTIGNFRLIPFIGAYGAAIATVPDIAYLIYI